MKPILTSADPISTLNRARFDLFLLLFVQPESRPGFRPVRGRRKAGDAPLMLTCSGPVAGEDFNCRGRPIPRGVHRIEVSAFLPAAGHQE